MSSKTISDHVIRLITKIVEESGNNKEVFALHRISSDHEYTSALFTKNTLLRGGFHFYWGREHPLSLLPAVILLQPY